MKRIVFASDAWGVAKRHVLRKNCMVKRYKLYTITFIQESVLLLLAAQIGIDGTRRFAVQGGGVGGEPIVDGCCQCMQHAAFAFGGHQMILGRVFRANLRPRPEPPSWGQKRRTARSGAGTVVSGLWVFYQIMHTRKQKRAPETCFRDKLSGVSVGLRKGGFHQILT